VRDRCSRPAGTHFVRGFDADGFLVTLAQRLGAFPPKFVDRPFSHLLDVLRPLPPYTIPGEGAEEDVLDDARAMIQQAVDTLEPAMFLAKAQALLMANRYEDVVALQSRLDDLPSTEVADALAWGYVLWGNALSDWALRKEGAEADRLFGKSEERNVAALAIKQDNHEALNNGAPRCRIGRS